MTRFRLPVRNFPADARTLPGRDRISSAQAATRAAVVRAQEGAAQ